MCYNKQPFKRQAGDPGKQNGFASCWGVLMTLICFSSASLQVCSLSWDVPLQPFRYLRSWRCGKTRSSVTKGLGSMGRYVTITSVNGGPLLPSTRLHCSWESPQILTVFTPIPSFIKDFLVLSLIYIGQLILCVHKREKQPGVGTMFGI